MKTTPLSSRRSLTAFTLVEMLTVIAIIAILAAMIMPAISLAKVAAQKNQAKVEISQIVGAIQQYDSVYGRFPVSRDAQNATTNDFTYGGVFTNGSGLAVPVYTPGSAYQTNNSEVIAILMDVTTNAITHQTVNFNHAKNPQQTIFLGAKMSGYDPASNDPQPPGGVDITGVYRDPWGSPYVISMDLNYDEQCVDAFYSLRSVSQSQINSQTGYNGLFNPDANGNTDHFRYHGKVMVWSVGPDRKIDNTLPARGPLSGVNKDNILSWQ